MVDYSYQPAHIERIIEELSTKRKVLGQLPTGGGKTWEFSLISDRFIKKMNKSVLIIVHREELLKQAARTIEKVTGIKPSLITSETKRTVSSRVYIAMVDSLTRRLHMIASEVGLVIIDECHINNFIKMHSIFLDELILGFTATPISASKKEPLNKYYKSIICGPQISELIKLGSLAQNITRVPKDIVDSSKFTIDKLKGDYKEKQMYDEFKQYKFVSNVVKYYLRFCKGKKTLVFNVNKEHSKQVNELFVSCGLSSKNLDSDSDDRAEIFQWFKETPDAIMNSVMIPTVGFDEPTVQSVILNFSTTSITKFIQCSGRGSRAIDGLKYHFDIIDLGGNYTRFGDWNQDRDWEYLFNHPDKHNEGIAPVKSCPKCLGLIHAALMKCNLTDENGDICGYEFEKKTSSEREPDLEEVEMVTKGIDIDAIVNRSQNKYEYYPFFRLGEDVVNAMYQNHSIITDKIVFKYFYRYYDLCIEWYNKTLAGRDGNIKDIKESSWHIKRAKNNFNSLMKKLKPENAEIKLTD